MNTNEHHNKDVKPEWICPRCGYRNAADNESCGGAEMGDGRCGKLKPEPKPPAQYLAKYLDKYLSGEVLPRELLEQALAAYESTEHVRIIIQKV